MTELREKHIRAPTRSFDDILKASGLSKARLAEELGVSVVAVWHWVYGRTYPSIDLLPKLSSMLCVSLDELVPVLIHDRRGRQ